MKKDTSHQIVKKKRGYKFLLMNNTEQWTNIEAYKGFWVFLIHSVSQLFLITILPTAKSKQQQHKLFHKIMNDTTYLNAYFGENTLKV
jgi:hypothetical protein